MSNENLIFLFLNQNVCCGYSKEPSQWDGSFEHPKHMLELMGKKIFTILRWNFFVYLNLCKGAKLKKKFEFLYQNFVCTQKNQPSHWYGSFEHQKQMFKPMD